MAKAWNGVEGIGDGRWEVVRGGVGRCHGHSIGIRHCWASLIVGQSAASLTRIYLSATSTQE